MIYNKRYSRWIKPVLFTLDLLIICLVSYYLLSKNIVDSLIFVSFWICLSLIFSFLTVYKFTKLYRIVGLTSRQIAVFTLLIFTYYYIRENFIHFSEILRFFLVLIVGLNLWKVILHILFKKYGIVPGSNYNKVVIIGRNNTTKKLESFFNNEPEYGYKYLGFFTNKEDQEKLGSIENSLDYIIDNQIDEIYCSTKELSNEQMSELVLFSDNNLKSLKFIPDNKYIFSKKLKFENYDLLPILSLSDIPLKIDQNKIVKRVFDIFFSLVVIICILSWFTPILALLIRIESKGPIFFKQMRYGAGFDLFPCYKFRSMRANKESDVLQASKNDARVTSIGKFIRRTSIDELPQFFNVLFGTMSVVGPRPLLLSHTNDYKNKINKFMIRHTVKPGITGLAQVSGYRGNIETDMDMQNRVKYDIFYVENWSLFLDLKIIFKTIFNIVKGEEKAY